MQRHKQSFPLGEYSPDDIKQRMLEWANQFGILLFLDSNQYSSVHGGYECLLAAGQAEAPDLDVPDPLTALGKYHDSRKDWLFGHVCYDFKNTLEPALSSGHPANVGFVPICFFIPETVCYIRRGFGELVVETFGDPGQIFDGIIRSVPAPADLPRVVFSSRVDKDLYLRTVDTLRKHIRDGDCYEINFCSEGYSEKAEVAPLGVFRALNKLSPAPFAAFYRNGGRYMMCASPERYLRLDEGTLMSQPIKGTARRDPDPARDDKIREQLRNDIKEQAENVMIVDLVRNDLARSAETGSVRVEELFGIYTFPQVHQMISTVTGALGRRHHFADAIRYSFPMGSMTGAPKYKVMQLIERYERSRRELFSGSVGYITPGGNFDFNVVIRSIFYNGHTGYLSYQAGGAITYDSVPEKEWEEMRLKSWALERIFS